MKRTLFLVLAILVTTNAESQKEVGGIGGEVVEEGAHPYQAALVTNENHYICSGAIITSRAIVTAARCVTGRTPKTIFVIVGTNQLSSGGTRYATSSIRTHYNFNEGSVMMMNTPFDSFDAENDIAVVITAETIVFGPKVQLIKLYYSNFDKAYNVTFTGWGGPTYDGLPKDPLQRLDLRTTTFYTCNDINDVVYKSNVCTIRDDGNCKIDNGGPLVLNGTLVGVKLWRKFCAFSYPDVFTRISSFASWIDLVKEPDL